MVDRMEEARQRDADKINRIRQKWDLDRIKDLQEVLALLQAGSLRFETQLGIEFDDELYERMRQIEQGVDKKKKHVGSSKRKSSSAKNLEDQRTVQDSPQNSAQMKKEKNRRLIMRASMLIAVLSLGYFTFYCYQAYNSGQEFEALSELKNTDFTLYRPARVTVDDPGEAPDILEDYVTLYNKNKSLIGWLKIDDTIIDYPVMYSKNEEYYLNHNFNQQKDRNGSLFIDSQCSIWPRSQNIIIYGHNMKSGKMFGSLSKYKNKDYYEKHPTIKFDTLYEKGEYQVMYVFSEIVHDEAEVTFKYYQFVNANSEQEYDSNMEEMKKMSLYETGITSRYGDELITLSTCDYTEGAERFAVIAKRIN